MSWSLCVHLSHGILTHSLLSAPPPLFANNKVLAWPYPLSLIHVVYPVKVILLTFEIEMFIRILHVPKWQLWWNECCSIVLPVDDVLISLQVIVIPCGITANRSPQDKENLFSECEKFIEQLKEAGIRCRGDFRDNYTPGWKYNHWELKVSSLLR